MAGRQGSGGARYAAISVVLLAIVQCAMAATYTVGGSAGWNLNVDYSTWASPIAFKVGDTLLFKYNAELHSVLQVSQANLKTCTTTGPLKSYQSGSDSVTLTDATTYNFICGTLGHCASGMAVTIAVSGGSTPTPAPTISPAPKVSPLPSPPKAVPSPAPASHSPSPSPIAPSPSKTSPSPSPSKTSPSPSPSKTIPSPSPSEAIPSPSPSEAIPSPSSETSPSSPPTASSAPPPGSLTPSSPASPQGSVPPPPSNAPSTLHSGTVVLFSAVLLGGFSLFF